MSVKFLLRILYLKYFIPAQGFASPRQKNATPFTYLTSPSLPYPPFVSYFSFLFRDEGLSYHAFAAVAVCQFSFLLGILHIFPISFCCYGVHIYFPYINLLLQGSPIVLLYLFVAAGLSYIFPI